MSLFSKQNKEVLGGPLNINNPILVQILGICSALAVTSQLKPAIVMGLAVTRPSPCVSASSCSWSLSPPW